MGLKRREDWPIRMDAFARDSGARAFVWGAWDCCLSTLAHVDAISDKTYYDEYAGRWSDRDSAQAEIERLGGYETAVTAVFGPPLAEKRKAQRGDIVLFDSGAGAALGFIDLTGMAVLAPFEGRPGLIRIRLDRVLTAWRI